MRLLFSLPHAAYLRNFESTLRLLSERGHDVVLAMGSAGKPALADPECRLAELEAELPGLVVQPGIEQILGAKKAGRLGRELRSWLDFMRYLEPPFENATDLRERAARGLDPRAIEAALAAAADPVALSALRASVAARESRLPIPEDVVRYVESHAPDAVIVSPLMQKGTPQTGYLRAAHRLGVPCGLCVASWDNMTTSTLIHGDPDLVTVWNPLQLDEAVRLHGIPEERVAVVGAPLHDLWFESRPSTSRAEFCARSGLPDGRPYILYVGSSPQIAPAEARWILRWVTRIRAAEEELARAQVLVRPHPYNPLDADTRALARLEGLPGVAVHPRRNRVTVTPSAHQDYFDAIHHSAAVVGVNTSAMIEAAIVGRGVHVLLSRRMRQAQEGRPHFDYLVSAGGGLLKVSDGFTDHAAGLTRAVRGEDSAERRRRAELFLRAFVRPHGLKTPVTPLMVDALESLRRPTAPPRAPSSSPAPRRRSRAPSLPRR